MGTEDFTGFTIHSGWYPQLLKGNPAKQFSSKKGTVRVKGYNQAFVEQVQKLDEERQSQLMGSGSGDIITKAFDMATEVAGSEFGVGLDATDVFDAMPAKKKYRAARWSDMVGAKEYEQRSAKFSIRGTHIWYLQSDTGPKAMAKALLERNNFTFKKAERWYTSAVAGKGADAMVSWAQKQLGLGDDLENIDIADVEHAGDAAEETVIKGNKLGMKKPKKTGTGAHGRDIDSSSLGEVESTERKLGGHHGMPDDVVSQYAEWQKTNAGKSWETFMRQEVISEWNKYVKELLSREKGSNQKIIQEFKKKPAGESKKKDLSGSSVIGRMSLSQNRKMRHEIAIADIESQTKGFGTKWKEGIPITGRNPHTGTRTYASHDLELNKNYQYKLNAVKYVTGLSHTLALAENEKLITQEEAGAIYISQQNHYAHSKMNTSGEAVTINNVTQQGYNSTPTKCVKNTLNVSFSPKITKEWLEEFENNILKKAIDDASKRGGQISDKLMKKAKAQGNYGDIFWALPYISVEEGLYRP